MCFVTENTSNSEVISLIVTGYIAFALTIIILLLGLVCGVYIGVALCRQEKKGWCFVEFYKYRKTGILVFMVLQTTTYVIMILEQILRQEFIITLHNVLNNEGYTRCILLILHLLIIKFLE